MADEKTAFTDTTTDVSDEPSGGKEQKLGEKAWYVVNTYSTHENKVAYNLRKRVESMGLEDLIFRIVVAEQEVPVMDRETGLPTGKTRMKNLYPGYVFVEMIMTDYAWYIVRNTPGVTGFVGSSGKGTKPFPVPREQIEPVLKRMGIVDDNMYDRYQIGDYIKVIRGTLEGTEGRIVSIDKDTGAVEIETVFFGRTTKVEVDFSEIERV
ncbi:MAG: transcription termination/antitermination protein NusG [Bacilli bacterium]|nr:transcription termination/antitermination protein NusG [Bacilli bacterium]